MRSLPVVSSKQGQGPNHRACRAAARDGRCPDGSRTGAQSGGYVDGHEPPVRRVRELLGESRDSLETNGAQLARVTTSSFKALHLYSQAEVLLRRDRPMRPAEAEDLLRQAVEEDPEFPSAHLLLGKALAGPELWVRS